MPASGYGRRGPGRPARTGDEFPDIDTSKPSAARLYNAALGGKDNFAADRMAVQELTDMLPKAPPVARQNRLYLGRVVRYLVAECGIRQLIDNGSGLPEDNNVHKVAQSIDPGARVVYIDNDPIVLRHQTVHALASSEVTAFILADARNVDQIMDHPDTRRLIDFSEPVALLYLSFLHMIPDADDPWGIVRKALGRFPSGSYLAISHTVSADPAVRERVTSFFLRKFEGRFGRIRDPAEVRAFFDGLEVVPPGLVNVANWRAPDADDTGGAEPDLFIYGGVGRKPG